MTMIISSVLSIVVVSLLLIAGSIENAAKIQQAMAQNSAGGNLKLGPLEKMTITGLSRLSPEQKQVLEQDQAKIHHNPQLSSSDQAILGPILGTQTK